MNKLDQKILKTYLDLKKKEKIQIHKKNVQEKMAADIEKAILVEQKIDALGIDLHQRQHSTLEKIKGLLFEDNEEKIEDLKLNYFLQIMNLKSLKKEIDLYKFELTVLETQLVKLECKELELKKLFQQKEEELLKNHPDSVNYLLEIQDHILFQKLLIEEMEEAIPFGEKAMKLLDSMMDDVGLAAKAKKFTMYGRYSQKDKISYLEQIKNDVEMLYHWMQKFNLELMDISIHLNVDFSRHIKQFKSLSKELVQTHFDSKTIERLLFKAQVRLKYVRHKVFRAIEALEKDIGKAERSIKRAKRKKELLIIQDIKRRR